MAIEEQCIEQLKSDSYKIKMVNFFDRTVPIILQNDNGPCPLLAICNVLSLRNNLNLTIDGPDVSQQRLLHLVAERLLDVSNNTENKDAGYVNNQLQNIADAIDLVPSLATGIDVNVRFGNIHDFEFTPVCSIFDLLEINLVHGWIVDPQDTATASVIGSNSYNTLMEKLVALEARNIKNRGTSDEDSVDFVAATTATLGVPSPCLSKVRSFDDPPVAIALHQKLRKGDAEEAEQLMKVLELSKPDSSDLINGYSPAGANENNAILTPDSVGVIDSEENSMGTEDPPGANENNAILTPDSVGVIDSEENSKSMLDHGLYETKEPKHEEDGSFITTTTGVCLFDTACAASISVSSDESENDDLQTSKGHVASGCIAEEDKATSYGEAEPFVFPNGLLSASSNRSYESHTYSLKEVHVFLQKGPEDALNQLVVECENVTSTVEDADVEISNFDGDQDVHDLPIDTTSSLDDSEPIYEGEDVVQDACLAMYQDQEPIYEGEMVLAKQGDKSKEDECGNQPVSEDTQPCNRIVSLTAREGQLIQHFLMNNASQLTIYGLFCLQEHLKEHALCVFFRNNHFNTMFKHEGQLYLLATDQGYLNQPDLVWEKLNEVNGDTLFVTGNFEEFRVRNGTSSSWDEQNAMSSTAEYLASMDKAALTESMSSDLQLAIALQQQEFESQPQEHHNSQVLQKPSVVPGGSGLVTGPNVRRSPPSLVPRQEAKSKEKCVVM